MFYLSSLFPYYFPTSGINPATQGASLTEGKRERRRKKLNGEANGDDGSSPRDEDDDWNDSCLQDQCDDDDWVVDVSEEAVRDRQRELSEGVKSLALTEDSEKPEKDRMDIFYKFLESKLKDGGKLDDKDLLGEADRLDVRAKSALILAELLFDQNILAQVSLLILKITRNKFASPSSIPNYELLSRLKFTGWYCYDFAMKTSSARSI
jgi:translation initiation factor 5